MWTIQLGQSRGSITAWLQIRLLLGSWRLQVSFYIRIDLSASDFYRFSLQFVLHLLRFLPVMSQTLYEPPGRPSSKPEGQLILRLSICTQPEVPA
jgi:hypothetical protein